MGIAAAVHAAWPQEAEERPPAQHLPGEDAPPPGVLPGRLVVAGEPGCRLRTIDLVQMRVGPAGPATACRLWTAPAGALAVVARAVDGDRRRQELWVVELRETPRLVRRLGAARSGPSWSADGTRVAWCRDDGTSAVLEIESSDPPTELPGCFPRILAGGKVVTRLRAGGRAQVLEEGRLLLDDRDLERGLPERGTHAGVPRVFGSGQTPDGGHLLGVLRTVSGFTTEGAVQLWRGGRLEQAVPIVVPYLPASGFFGLRIDVSPDLSEAALVFPEVLGHTAFEGVAALLQLASGRLAPGFSGGRFGGLAWSPDGAWLAVTSSEGIRILGSNRSSTAYVVPVLARAVGWVPSPSQ